MAGKRIVALVGDFYHQAGPMRDALRAVADALDAVVEPVDDPATLDWSALPRDGALVVARENRLAPQEDPKATWITQTHESGLAAFVAGGGSLAVLHAGLASYPFEGPWWDTVRGGFLFHPSEHPHFTVRSLEVPHPSVRGFSGLSLTDEMYFVRVDAARTTRLLEVSSPDYGVSCAAWAHAVGKGRVFCLTPGHTAQVLADPGYRSLLGNGLRWVMDRGA